MVKNPAKLYFRGANMIFADAPGGTGKTHTIPAICSTLRGDGKIVVTTASSGIAAQMLPGGKTCHSKFKIPIPIRETCDISGHKMILGGNYLGKQH